MRLCKKKLSLLKWNGCKRRSSKPRHCEELATKQSSLDYGLPRSLYSLAMTVSKPNYFFFAAFSSLYALENSAPNSKIVVEYETQSISKITEPETP